MIASYLMFYALRKGLKMLDFFNLLFYILFARGE